MHVGRISIKTESQEQHVGGEYICLNLCYLYLRENQLEHLEQHSTVWCKCFGCITKCFQNTCSTIESMPLKTYNVVVNQIIKNI